MCSWKQHSWKKAAISRRLQHQQERTSFEAPSRGHRSHTRDIFQLSIFTANTEAPDAASLQRPAQWRLGLMGHVQNSWDLLQGNSQVRNELRTQLSVLAENASHCRNWSFTSFLALSRKTLRPCRWVSSVCGCCWCYILAWSWLRAASPPMWLHRGGACMESALHSEQGW